VIGPFVDRASGTFRISLAMTNLRLRHRPWISLSCATRHPAIDKNDWVISPILMMRGSCFLRYQPKLVKLGEAEAPI